MIYTVYTDGSGSDIHKVIGSAYIILTDCTYVGYGYSSVQGLQNPTYAETIAVGIAATKLLQEVGLKEDDEVIFMIDCASTIDFCRDLCLYNTDKEVSGIPLVKASISVIRKLCQSNKVCFKKVEAHKNVISPNTFVDKVARFCIRR